VEAQQKVFESRWKKEEFPVVAKVTLFGKPVAACCSTGY